MASRVTVMTPVMGVSAAASAARAALSSAAMAAVGFELLEQETEFDKPGPAPRRPRYDGQGHAVDRDTRRRLQRTYSGPMKAGGSKDADDGDEE